MTTKINHVENSNYLLDVKKFSNQGSSFIATAMSTLKSTPYAWITNKYYLQPELQ